MAISIKDIARLAGVSHSTVSRALHGSPLIPAITAERIKNIADEIGYSASAIGRGLVSGRTEAIGVVVTSISDPFNGEVVAGLEDAANEKGYSVILVTSQTSPKREISVVRTLQSRRVDGIIVASSRVGASYTNLLAGTNVPVVLLNNQHPDEAVYSVRIDNRRGAFDATQHLVELGHQRIAYMGDKSGLHSDADRLHGYQDALGSAGIKPDPTLQLTGDGKVEAAHEAFAAFVLSLREKKQALPTAVFCYNDMSAVGVMEAAKQLRLSVPRDLSVVGFDDIQVAALLSPSLTTIRQPKWELGHRSMRLMLAILNGGDADKSIVLPGELMIRDSTCSPGSG